MSKRQISRDAQLHYLLIPWQQDSIFVTCVSQSVSQSVSVFVVTPTATICIRFSCVAAKKSRKKSLKTHIFGVQSRSRSLIFVPPESSSSVPVMIRSKSVSICNHSRARLVDSSRHRTFSKGGPNLMRSYGGLLVPRGSKLALLKSTFNAKNFICRSSWSISSDFDAVHCWNVCGSHKSRKTITKNPILGFKVVQGHRCWYSKKARQQCLLWCAASLVLSATILLLDWTTVAETASFEGGTQIWWICTEDSLNL